MEFVDACPHCKGAKLVLSHQSTDHLVSGVLFSVYLCITCGLCFTNPRPLAQDAGFYYQSDSYISHNDTKRGWVSELYRLVRSVMIRYKLRIINRYLDNFSTRKNIVDIGCGTGEFLLLARKKRFNTIGVEPDKKTAEIAISKGLEVVSSDENLKVFPNKYFDVITLWHVLEHIYFPNEKIAAFEKLLRDDGIIIVAIPEYKSFDSVFYKQNWAGWDLPRHVYHYNETTLTGMMKRFHFQLIGKHPMMFDAFYISLLSEKNLHSRLGILRAFTVGAIANILAIFGSYPFSSQIYVFKKEKNYSSDRHKI